MRPFYVTTPAYYVNSAPHVGTAYTTVAADVFARHARLRGRPTRFLTGLDEHGLKIARRAEEEGLAPQPFADRMTPDFLRAWEALGIAHDDFIRTTDARHIRHVQELWKRVADRGDIYLGDYEDWYCVGCEGYYTEKDLLPGNLCPVHKTPIERIKEQTYFFRLSKYTEPLLAHYEKHPEFVRPEGRLNEVKSFVKEGLRDLSVSRTSFRWGVPVPGNPEHVMYVWFDALGNYVSALGGPTVAGDDDAPFRKFWPEHGEAVHLVGKDILRFHTVYWPAFLMSAGLPLPTTVQVHGFLTVNGEKISKSMGNAIAPIPLAEALGADVLRYYLMRDFSFGQDGDFVHANLLARYHGDLGNGLGNLLNRMVSIVNKSLGGTIPHVHADQYTDLERSLIAVAERAAAGCTQQFAAMAPARALEAAWELVLAANKYVDATAPWALVKAGDPQKKRLEVVAYTVLEAVRWLSLMLWPVMPVKSDGLRDQLGLPPVRAIEEEDRWPSVWGGLVGGTATKAGIALFPRLDEAQQKAVLERWGVLKPTLSPPSSPEKREGSEPTPPSSPSFISFDDFAKVDLRVGLVRAAERVPKSDKLLKLQVDLGEAEPRQILAGIAKQYTPEELVGRRIVVVANLAPRKMMGLTSQGMVLAAGAGEREVISVLGIDKELPPGSEVR